MLSNKGTTIAALSTPPGYAGIAIIRLSGKRALEIGNAISGKTLTPYRAHFCHLYANDKRTQILDEAICLYFPAPHSFTGEDTVELQIHGNPLIVEVCLQRLCQLGASMAEAGEFSERAFLNNKIDLTQAEAIMDLIHASSIESLKISQQTLQGKFTSYIDDIATRILNIRANIELALDFPDEEVDFIDKQASRTAIENLSQLVQTAIDEASQGKLLTEGIHLVIAGEPNVGKSTLLNCLLREKRAIVSDIAGTTRDILNERMLLDGIPIHISDTAGIRESDNEIEQEGIRLAKETMKKADIILILSSTTIPPLTITQELPNHHTITVINKCDLDNLPAQDLSTGERHCVRISAQEEWGIDLLKDKIKAIIQYKPKQAKFSARTRSVNHLEQSQQYLQEALQTLDTQPELCAESLKLAHQSLSHITGKIITDDILEVIFREFCIGK